MMAAPARSMDNASVGEVEVTGGTVPVAIAGGGPPLVLLHGWTLDHRMWEPQLETLGRHYRLIMIDRRGFGRSTAPPDLNSEAQDIAIVADVLGIDRFALAGLSQGAAVALDFAVHFPDRVSALMLAGTPLPGLVPDPDNVPRVEYAALAHQGKFSELRRHWLDHDLMQVGNDVGKHLLENIVSDYDARDLLRASSLPPFSDAQIAALPMPLLAMAGAAESRWRIACARMLAETAPLGQFTLVNGAGHIANIDQPDAFNGTLLQFLAANCQYTS
jgi:pimeloyl-ACP methyl ester carboxylesterase